MALNADATPVVLLKVFFLIIILLTTYLQVVYSILI